MRNATLGLQLVAILSLVACGGGGTTIAVFGQPASQTMVIMLNPSVGGNLQFWGQGADADCQALTYAWDFDGDGTADSSLQSPTNAFGSEGAFECRCTVTDATGNTGESTCVVVAGSPASAAPAVSLRCYTLLGESGLVTCLIADGEDVDAGTVTSFDWDFNGDGTFDLNDPVGGTSTQVRTYNATGQVVPTVRANSSDGGSSIATLTLYLCPPDTMPQYGAGVQIESFAPAIASVGATEAYVGSTEDPSGGPVTLDWDLDGDGVFDNGTGFEVTSPPFAGDTVTAIRLRATDGIGNVTTAELTQPVVDTGSPAPDHPPYAGARACTLVGSLGTPIQFLGEGADQETAVTFSWDLDSDGTEDSTDQNPVFTYTERGLYTPTLTVEDATGNTSQAHLSLVIECCEGTTPGPPGPWFKCTCPTVAIMHGGTVTVPITCTPMGPPPPVLPTEGGVTSCNGGAGIGPGVVGFPDPNCAEVMIMPAPGTLGGPPFAFTLTSTAVDGPPRAVPYTIAFRLRAPGIMSINLKCFVWVIHNWIRASCGLLGSAPTFTCVAQVDVPAPGANPFLPGPGQYMPEIVEMRLVHAQQLPPWANSVYNAGFAGATPNWMQVADPNALRLTVDPGLGPTMQPGFSGGFEWQYQAPNPPAPPQMNAMYFDAAGNLVGEEPLFVIP